MPTAGQLLNHSLVCIETMASNCGQPLCPLPWIPTPWPPPCTHSRSHLLPWWPRGLWKGMPEEGTLSVPPCSCLLLPGIHRKPRDRSESEESALDFGEATPSAEPLPSLDPEQLEIQGDDPKGKQLPPSSQRTSRRGRVGKGSETRRPRCYSGFIFSPP